MAINTDTDFLKSSLGEAGGGAPAAESQETEKLLALTSEPGGNGMKMSASFTVNVDGTKGLEADQNGHGAGVRSGSVGQLSAAAPLSPSKASLSRSSTGNAAMQESPKPKDYLILVIMSCFCPVWPVSIVALVYSIMVSNDCPPGGPRMAVTSFFIHGIFLKVKAFLDQSPLFNHPKDKKNLFLKDSKKMDDN